LPNSESSSTLRNSLKEIRTIGDAVGGNGDVLYARGKALSQGLEQLGDMGKLWVFVANSRHGTLVNAQIAELIFDLIVTHDHKPSFLALEEGMTYVKLCQASNAVRGKVRGSLSMIIAKEEGVIPEFLGGKFVAINGGRRARVSCIPVFFPLGWSAEYEVAS
jgi:hypothetical protein